MYKVYRMVMGVKVYVHCGCTQFPEKRARELAGRLTVNGRKVYLIERVEG